MTQNKTVYDVRVWLEWSFFTLQNLRVVAVFCLGALYKRFNSG